MATFLGLAQKVGRESGTISGNLPATATGQVGRLAKIVAYTADAWVYVQNSQRAWRFMRKEFSGNTTAGTARYTPASWTITDHLRWIHEYDAVTLYLTATGVSDEGTISPIDWATWRRLYDRGTQVNGRPIGYAISPANEFCLGAIPDAAYTVRGEYYRNAQRLAADGDTPICPEDFHDVIVWRAIQLLVEHDEAPALLLGAANAKYRDLHGAMMRDQLNTPAIGSSPIA